MLPWQVSISELRRVLSSENKAVDPYLSDEYVASRILDGLYDFTFNVERNLPTNLDESVLKEIEKFHENSRNHLPILWLSEADRETHLIPKAVVYDCIQSLWTNIHNRHIYAEIYGKCTGKFLFFQYNETNLKTIYDVAYNEIIDTLWIICKICNGELIFDDESIESYYMYQFSNFTGLQMDLWKRFELLYNFENQNSSVEFKSKVLALCTKIIQTILVMQSFDRVCINLHLLVDAIISFLRKVNTNKLYYNEKLTGLLANLNTHIVCLLYALINLIEQGKVLGKDKSTLIDELLAINTNWQEIPTNTLNLIVRCFEGTELTKEDISNVFLPLTIRISKIVQDDPTFLSNALSFSLSLINLFLLNCDVSFLVNYLTETKSSSIFAEALGKILQHSNIDKCFIWENNSENPYWGLKKLINYSMQRLPKHVDIFLFLFVGAMPHKNFREEEVRTEVFNSLFNPQDLDTAQQAGPLDILKQILFSPLQQLSFSANNYHISNSESINSNEKFLILQGLVLEDLGYSQNELTECWDKFEFGQIIYSVPVLDIITFKEGELTIDLKNVYSINRHTGTTKKEGVSFSLVHLAWLSWHAIKCKGHVNLLLSAYNAFFSRLLEVYPSLIQILELFLSNDYFPNSTSNYLFGPINLVYQLGISYQFGLYPSSVLSALKAILKDEPKLAALHSLIFLYAIDHYDAIPTICLSRLINVLAEHIHSWSNPFSSTLHLEVEDSSSSYSCKLEYYLTLTHNFAKYDFDWQVDTLIKISRGLSSESWEDILSAFTVSSWLIDLLSINDLKPDTVKNILLSLGQIDISGLVEDVVSHRLTFFASDTQTLFVSYNPYQLAMYSTKLENEWKRLYSSALTLLSKIVKIGNILNIKVLSTFQANPRSLGLLDSLVATLCLTGYMESHGTQVLQLLLSLARSGSGSLASAWGSRTKQAIKDLMSKGEMQPHNMFVCDSTAIELTDLLCHFCLPIDENSPNVVHQDISNENKCLIIKILATGGFNDDKCFLLAPTLLETTEDFLIIEACLEFSFDFDPALMLSTSFRIINNPEVSGRSIALLIKHAASSAKKSENQFTNLVFKDRSFIDHAMPLNAGPLHEDILNELLKADSGLVLNYGLNGLVLLQSVSFRDNLETWTKLSDLVCKTLPLARLEDFDEFASHIKEESTGEILSLILHKCAIELVGLHTIPKLLPVLYLISPSWFKLTVVFVIKTLSLNLDNRKLDAARVFSDILQTIPQDFFKESNEIEDILVELVKKVQLHSLYMLPSVFEALKIGIAKGYRKCKNIIAQSRLIQTFYHNNIAYILDGQTECLDLHIQVLLLAYEVLDQNEILSLLYLLFSRINHVFTTLKEYSLEADCYIKLLSFIPSFAYSSQENRAVVEQVLKLASGYLARLGDSGLICMEDFLRGVYHWQGIKECSIDQSLSYTHLDFVYTLLEFCISANKIVLAKCDENRISPITDKLLYLSLFAYNSLVKMGVVRERNILTSKIKNYRYGASNSILLQNGVDLVSKFILQLKEYLLSKSIPDSNKRFIMEILHFAKSQSYNNRFTTDFIY